MLYDVCHEREVGSGVIHLGRTRKYSKPVNRHSVMCWLLYGLCVVIALFTGIERYTSEWSTLLEHGL